MDQTVVGRCDSGAARGADRRRHQPDRPEARSAHDVDNTATGHPTVYVSGGRRGLDIGLSPAELIAVTKARTAAIAR
ncbi:hypothetical protein OG558_22915 [Kribbella sp. NBC_01510]|uniref:hypothetical protein n=1 Tax=Kribbella sp. NBC_01510 TaxID=2903581 RepID=UPI003865F0B4